MKITIPILFYVLKFLFIKKQFTQIILEKFFGIFLILNGVGCTLFCFYKILLLWGEGILVVFIAGLTMLGGGFWIYQVSSNQHRPDDIFSGVEDKLKNIHLISKSINRPYKLLGTVLGVAFLGLLFVSKKQKKT